MEAIYIFDISRSRGEILGNPRYECLLHRGSFLSSIQRLILGRWPAILGEMRFIEGDVYAGGVHRVR